jgi:hypothetical protein
MFNLHLRFFAMLLAVTLVGASTPVDAASLTVSDRRQIAAAACMQPHRVGAQHIEVSGVANDRARVVCAPYGQQSGFAIRSRARCSRVQRVWDCRFDTLSWIVPLTDSTVDIAITSEVSPLRAAAVARYASDRRLVID